MQHNPAQLAQAFEAFNALSSQLTDSYRDLEQRVAVLTAELARARDERLRELQAKEQLARRLASLIEALPGGLLVLDGDGHIVEANLTAQQWLGLPLINRAWDEVEARAFARDASGTAERRLANGRYVSLSVSRLGAGAERIILLSDVTEAHRLQLEIERKQRLAAMGEMVARLAHQLRTPLAASILYAGQLSQVREHGVQHARVTERLAGRLQHLDRLVHDMLVFARGGSCDLAECQVHDLFTDVLRSIEPLLGAQDRIRIATDLPGLSVTLNREAMAGALTNLANNAIEAAAGKPLCIELDARVNDDAAVEMTVSDNGPGLPAAVTVEQLFEPFFTTRSHGTGLGLAVVRAVAESHGGQVFARNGDAGGAVFGLRLPQQSMQLLPGGRVDRQQEQSEVR